MITLLQTKIQGLRLELVSIQPRIREMVNEIGQLKN
jgi:hypothetical protein